MADTRLRPRIPIDGTNGKVLTTDNTQPYGVSWATPSGGGAPTTATYIVVSLNGTLTDERRLQGTANRVTLTDGGAGGDLTLDVGSSVYVSGGTDVAVADGGTGASTAASARTNLGIATAGRCAVVTAQGVATATGYELATVQGQRYLRTKRRTAFEITQTIAAASPEFGWTWANRTALDGGDENSTTTDGSYWDHGNTSTDWNAAKTAPWRYRTYPWPEGRVFVVTSRIKCNADQTWEYAQIMVTHGGADTPFTRIGPGYEGGGGPHIGTIGSGTNATTTITTAQRDAGVWVRIIVSRQRVECYYSTSSGSTPPTSWTLLAQGTSMTGATGSKDIRIGQVLMTNNTSNTFTASWLYYDVQWTDVGAGIDGLGGVFNDSMSGLLWPACKFDASGTAQLVVDDIDLGSDAPAVDNTRLRLILADLENRLQGDSATVTWSYKTSASTGATSGTFRAAGSVVDDGAGGRYLRLWVKITSDGDTAGSIGPLPFAIPTT